VTAAASARDGLPANRPRAGRYGGALPRAVDVLVIGAGIIGAACAHYAARAGLRVAVVERAGVAGGTTGAGEGNILVSDKQPGPELDLALLSHRLWLEIGDEVGDIELVRKGGLVVAASGAGLAGLRDLAARHEAAGVAVQKVTVPRQVEPMLTDRLAGGAYYPQDLQVQPMLAAARLLDLTGITVHCGVTAGGLRRGRDGRVTGVQTSDGPVAAGAVVNAAGVWAGAIAALAEVNLPVQPRRGFVLVTAPMPALIRHKVYAADYVSTVLSDDAGLQTSAVVEGTRSGTVLIGASRERVGLDRSLRLDVLGRLAAQAIALFPFLAGVAAIRTYRGFRPYCPDHLPVIGPDPRVPGLFHAAGHEGAGIGLAPATGRLLVQQITGEVPDLDPAPLRPDRFPC
jgi:glycine/D-amino acid oxidase-like deaminating enzyme